MNNKPKTETVLFEWADLGDGVQNVTYLGKAPFGTGVDDEKWEIKKFSYAVETDGKYYVEQIQTLDGKNWTDRASYPWT